MAWWNWRSNAAPSPTSTEFWVQACLRRMEEIEWEAFRKRVAEDRRRVALFRALNHRSAKWGRP